MLGLNKSSVIQMLVRYIAQPKTPSSTICEQCGKYPKFIDGGRTHPYCSKTCAQKADAHKISGHTAKLNTQSANQQIPFQDLCQECGIRPKFVDATSGYKHPFCSKTCAQRFHSNTNAGASNPVSIQTDLCQGCGKYPRAVESGIQYTHCSRICARKYTINNPNICALPGCPSATNKAVGLYCSKDHAKSATRPRHNSLQTDDMHLTVTDPRQVNSAVSSPVTPQPNRPRILFYHKHDPHYGFTNFSAHPVVYNGKVYPTSEHLFQSFKFEDHRPHLAEHIRICSDRPSVAFSEARRFQNEVRPNWFRVNIQKMDIALYYKFTQHPELRDELLATGDAELVEDSDKDSFWGIGADGKGRNELGKALERLRTLLRIKFT